MDYELRFESQGESNRPRSLGGNGFHHSQKRSHQAPAGSPPQQRQRLEL